MKEDHGEKISKWCEKYHPVEDKTSENQWRHVENANENIKRSMLKDLVAIGLTEANARRVLKIKNTRGKHNGR